MKTENVLRLTPRSWHRHAPVEIKYSLLKAGALSEIAMVTREYMPEARLLNLPEVRLSDLPLGSDQPLKILVFMPTYAISNDLTEYITERIKAALQQGRDFPPSWSLEIAVVVNGQNQGRLWRHLMEFREREGFSDRLTLALIPREKNPGMIQSKTTPMNVALDYARSNNFDVFSCLDDDVELSPQNLCRNIEYLRETTAAKNRPTMVGPQMRYALPEKQTWLDKLHVAAEFRNRSVKGCNMFFWTAALPSIPADAGNEDFLLKIIYGDSSVLNLAEGVHFVYRFAPTLGKFVRQYHRLKWNDVAAGQYLGDRFSFWKFLADPISRLFEVDQIFSKKGISHIFLGVMHLAAVYIVQAAVIARNALNIPKGEVDWVGTVDPESKSGITT